MFAQAPCPQSAAGPVVTSASAWSACRRRADPACSGRVSDALAQSKASAGRARGPLVAGPVYRPLEGPTAWGQAAGLIARHEQRGLEGPTAELLPGQQDAGPG